MVAKGDGRRLRTKGECRRAAVGTAIDEEHMVPLDGGGSREIEGRRGRADTARAADDQQFPHEKSPLRVGARGTSLCCEWYRHCKGRDAATATRGWLAQPEFPQQSPRQPARSAATTQ